MREHRALRLMKPPSTSRLRTRLVTISLLTVLPALGFIASTQSAERRRARTEALENNLRLTHLAANQQASVFNEAHRLLLTLARFPELRGGDAEGCAGVLPGILHDHPGYINLTVASREGSVLCLAAPSSPGRESFTSARGRSWFERALATRKTAIGEYQISVTSGLPSIAMAHPILDSSGEVERVIAATIAVDALGWGAKLELPRGATLTLFDRKGTILTRDPEPARWIGHHVPDAAISPAGTGSAEFVESVGVDGVRRLYTTVPVVAAVDTGLYVGMGIDRTALFAEAGRMLWRQIWLLLVVALAATVAALIAGEIFVLRPLNTLNAVADRLAAGDFNARAELAHQVPGLAELSTSINAMAAALEVRQRERDIAGQSLRASEDRYRHLFEENPHPMWVYDQDTLGFLAVNQAALDRYGYSRAEFMRLAVTDLHPEDERPAVERRPSRGVDRYKAVWRHRTKAGRMLTVEVSSNRIEWDGRAARLVLADDITERRQLEDQLRQAQKMEAVGQLAGGIAHDFNNLLTAIQGYAGLLAESLPGNDPSQRDVNEIAKAAQRAADLTRQLLAFSRKQILAPRVLRLGDVVTGVGSLLERLIGEPIEVRTIVADRGRVKADAGQIEQALINLAVNAKDAMPGGGRLTIETADVVLDDEFASGHPSVKAGPHVMLAVSDTGHGMDSATQGRIFEPFFTTKPKGQGTGLGLATVYGIVKQSGGSIWVESEVGRGTTFRVYFPRTEESAESAGTEAPAPPRAVGGRETILLVEDEDVVRAYVERVLRRTGYVVHAMPRAERAVAFVDRHAGTIDLLLTDVVLPDMNGHGLATELLQRRPEMKVLYMSGYTDGAIVHQGVLNARTAFLPKPFSAESLVRKIRETLASVG